jgi:transposase-like protein
MGKSKSSSRYSKILYQTRLKIIKYVCEEGLTIKRTAEILGLKPSTARMILKRYRDDGVVFERKEERHQRVTLPEPKNTPHSSSPETNKMDFSSFVVMPAQHQPYLPYFCFGPDLVPYPKYMIY